MSDTIDILEATGEEILLDAVVFGGAVGLILLTRKIVAHFQGSSAPKPAPPIDPTFADNVLKDLTTDLKLDPTATGDQAKEDRHRSFFIYRRALDLGIADATLRQPQAADKLKQQVKAEFIQVNNFLDERLWPDNANRGVYFGGTDLRGLDPRHLDLGNFIGVLKTDPPPTTEKDAVAAKNPTPTQVQTLHELDSRNMRVKGIVWRAAALHEVWTGAGADSKLQKFALTEILDRRLRTVERLHYEASSGATSGGFGTSFLSRDKEFITDALSSEANGWYDETRHRIFEAPSMPLSTTFLVGIPVPIKSSPPAKPPLMELRDSLRKALIELNLLVNNPGSPRFNIGDTTSSSWYQNQTTDEFDFNVWPGTRLKESLQTHEDPDDPNPKKKIIPFPREWKRVDDTPAARGYGWIMKPRNFAAEAIKELFVIGSQDLFSRSWLHADGVMSALHLEALFFGLRRRKALELDIQKTADERQKEEEATKALEAEEQQLDADEQSQKAMLNLPDLKPALAEGIHTRLDEIAVRRFEIFKLKIQQRGAQEDELNKIFNELPTKFSLALDDYFEVRRGIVRAENGIMGPGRTDHFENIAVPFDELQIGDQVLYETSPVLQALGSNAWEYPTVLITELDSSPPGKKLDPKKLTVQGFNTAELDQPSFRLLLAKSIDNTLNAIRKSIQQGFAREKANAQAAGRPFDPPDKFLWDPGLMSENEVHQNDRGTLRLWNPYDDKWDEPGPWWVWLNLKAPMWSGSFPLPVEKTLAKVPRGFVWLGTTLLFERNGEATPANTIPVGPGFKEPDWQDVTDEGSTADPKLTIFAPLFEPVGGWINYFTAKAKDKNAKRGPGLLPVLSDSSWFPGLAQNDSKIRVIRPQLKKQ